MVQLINVDHDPFAQPNKLVPVDYDPFAPKPSILDKAKRLAMAPIRQVMSNPKEAGRAAFDQGMQGMTLGWADEAQDALGASFAQLVNNPNDFFTTNEVNDPAMAEAMSNSRQDTQKRLESQWQNQPAVSLVSQLAGGILTGKALGSTAPVKKFADLTSKVGPALRLGPAKSAVVQDMLAAAPAGAIYGAGTAKDGERAAGAGTGALAAMGTAGVLSSGVQLANKALRSKPKIPSADEIRQQSNMQYQDAAQKGGILHQQFTDDFLNQLQGVKPKPIAGTFHTSESKKVIDAIDEFEQLRGKPLNLDDVQGLDEALSQKINNFIDPKTGRPDKTGFKLMDMQSKLRDMVENANPNQVVGGKQGFEALKEARKTWSQSRKMADIEAILRRAEQMDVPATGIKTGFRTLYNNPNRMRGYSTAEKAAIKKAAESGIVTDMLRTFGSRLIPIGMTLKGGPLIGPAMAAVMAKGSRDAASAVQASKANEVAKIIANRGQIPMKPIAPSFTKLLTTP